MPRHSGAYIPLCGTIFHGKTVNLVAVLICALILGFGSDVLTAKAEGSVANFDDINITGGNSGTPITAYDGFNWLALGGMTSGFSAYSTSKHPQSFQGNNYGVTSGNQAVYNTDGLNTAITLASTTSAFTLSSMEISDAKSSFDLLMIGYALVSGSYVQIDIAKINLTSANATLESFNWTNLSKLVFEALNPDGSLSTSFSTATTYRIDDFTYSLHPAGGSIPEPATWAGLAAAIAGVGGIALFRRKVKAAM